MAAGPTFFGLRGRHQCSDHQKFFLGLYSSDTDEEEKEKDKDARRSLIKGRNETEPKMNRCKISWWTRKERFLCLEKHAARLS